MLKSALVAVPFIALSFLTSGCGPGTPTQGIALRTKQCYAAANSPPNNPQCLPGSNLAITPYVPVWGSETGLYYNPSTGKPETQGSVDSFGNSGGSPLFTPAQGPLVVPNAMAPAFWKIDWLEPVNCGYNTDPKTGAVYFGLAYNDWYYYNVGYGYEVETDQLHSPNQQPIPNYYITGNGLELDCYTPPPYILPISTGFAILGDLPNTLTLGSEVPLTTAYGMPLLYVYDGTGTVVVTETATSVISNGTEATFPFPSTLAENGYSLAIVNQINGAPGFAPAGDNLLSIASSKTISGSPFGVAAQAVSTTWQSATNPDPYGDGTCAGQWTYDSGTNTNSSPVITQYALNQVSNGSATISVGSNPTAIAVYDSQTSQSSQNNGPCNSYQSQTTQMTRAIVANSGENTVSILDIVNNAVLDTVTVGDQPVALVLSPDGTTAYVANYTGGTVTEVNLNTDTPVTTVAVGGQPTSVALAAPSTLWVGGVGFLTQVNTQNMSVVATQSTAGETIAALGFSNAENELIATTMNSGGGVYVDEVSPSSVSPGTLYTAVASHPVSTLGTYFSPRTQTDVRGFTATLAQSLVPVSTNQVGAPPLVVQDGWAVISASPTGFTITDASGHDVLASETTPSPIAAIAVDTNLNMAYLTMPDSNTLLTVPLPGTSGTSGTNSASGSFAVTAANNNPAQTALSLGHSMSYTINVSPINGFTGTVALWVDGLPAGVTASLSPASITTSGNATLTLNAAYNNATYIGGSTVNITGTNGGIAQSAAIPLTTQPLQYRGYCGAQ